MCETAESSRMALEGEINRWSGFARALRKPDREAFDELMVICRNYVSECACVDSLTEFEPMVMSILLFQQRRIMQLERELEAIKPEKVNPSENYELSVPLESKLESNVQVVPNGGEQRRLF
jgi:hypothetical protein